MQLELISTTMFMAPGQYLLRVPGSKRSGDIISAIKVGEAVLRLRLDAVPCELSNRSHAQTPIRVNDLVRRRTITMESPLIAKGN